MSVIILLFIKRLERKLSYSRSEEWAIASIWSWKLLRNHRKVLSRGDEWKNRTSLEKRWCKHSYELNYLLKEQKVRMTDNLIMEITMKVCLLWNRSGQWFHHPRSDDKRSVNSIISFYLLRSRSLLFLIIHTFCHVKV